MRESILVTILYAVISFAVINFGFSSPYISQVNKFIWVDACFDQLSYNLKQVSGPVNQNTIASSKPIKEIQISLSVPPDSGGNKNSLNNMNVNPGLNNSVQSDTGKNNNRQNINNSNSSELNNALNLVKKDSSKSITRKDTLLFKKDTLFAKKDSVKKVDLRALDSTARVKYFKYHRYDSPIVQYKRNKLSSFFVKPSDNARQRTVKIDSTGKFVEFRETTGGQETKILLKIPIDEYLDLMIREKRRESWEDLAYQYQLNDTKRGLGELIKDFTDFEIPLPSVGVLTIFGPPHISLKIGGAVDIHGAWRNETTEGVTASNLGNSRNEPDFKQQVQINVNGTIGDKLNITADWNTERTFEYENQLKIKYTGYEDEIIQSIEGGNVSLQTSPLVGGSEALFGVKAQLKLGPLNLTALASQKKGEIKEVAVSGGSTSQTFQLRAYDYSRNHYFLHADYADTSNNLNLFNKYYGNAISIIDPAYRVVDIQVWKSVQTIVGNRSRERYANAYINLQGKQANRTYPDSLYSEINPIQGQSATGRFVLLTNGDDYILHPETGFISFKTQVNDNDIIAVAFRQENQPGPTDDIFYGDFITANDTAVIQKIVLKMIKPAFLQPQFTDAWKLQLKNIYPVGGRNIKQDGFDFQIKRETEGQEPATNYNSIRFLTAFGLDLYDASLTNRNPDNVFDWRANPSLTIMPATGEIIFPTLQPFGRNLPLGLDTTFRFNEVYDTSQTFARQIPVKDKWLLTGKYSGDVSSVYQLGFNIVENSVKVLLNGRQLSANTDYVVDYNIGQLTIRNDAALVPGADLRISFEQNDLFQLASKTLLGLRGLFDFSKKTKLGFSILNLNQQTLSQKVRIGEEPLNNTIYGVDFTTGADLPFITKGLDKIISTKEMSSFSVTGEYAYIKPDPNTIKSTIPSDQGKSIAYIDDFEAAKKLIPIGVSYTAWKDLSPPTELPQFSNISQEVYEDSIMAFKGKTFWYSITPSPVTVPMLWGTRKVVAKADQQVSTLDYVYIPDTPGTYAGYGKTIKPTDYTNPRKSWGGIMKLLSSTANNLVDENMEYIEFWANPRLCPSGSKIYIDLGRISEDVIPNKVLDTEDKPPYNDLIDPGEDNGLDGLTDAEEQVLYHSTKSDPAGDDFSFQNSTSANRPITDFFNINGTEGNAVLTDIGRIPDSEDLNRNGNLDLVNSYFRYEIPLDTVPSTNKYIQGGGEGGYGWFLYRIPLKDFKLPVGNPSLTSIETIRLFTTDVSQPMHLTIAEFNLVGNQWQQIKPSDSILTISVKSIEDNPDYYSPPGVNQERDLSNPNENVLRNEQALDLVVKDLPAGQSREIVKYIPGIAPLDVFSYSEMKLFVHGDLNPLNGNLSDSSGGSSYSQVYFRFGGDSLNYYEYRQPVKPDWNEIDIKFSDLTALKQKQDSAHSIIKESVPGKPGHTYQVKGNPTLTSVKFLLFGVINTDNPSRPRLRRGLTGDIWVNELRVIGADQTPGWAYSVATQLKLADLMTLNFTMSQTNPFFHRISDRFGSRLESKNWGFSADLDVIKLLPFNLPESSLRFNYSHTESISKPLYLPGTDILVSAAAYQDKNRTPEQVITESQTVNVSDSYSASNIKIKIPTNFWLIRDTFNNLAFGFNYNTTFGRSPTVLYNKSWQWNANASYGLNISPDYNVDFGNLPVFSTLFAFLPDYKKFRIYYLPQNFTAQISLRRIRTTNVTRVLDYQTGTLPQQTISRDFTSQRGFNFSWKMTEGGFFNISSNYNVNIASTLAYLETINQDQQRSESQIWKDIFAGAFFGKDVSYQQTVDIRTNPVLPSFLDIGKYFKIQAGYSAGYQWMYNIAQGDAGRSAGNSGKVSLGLNLSWKSLTQGLFADVPELNPQDRRLQGQGQISLSHRGRERNFEEEFKNYDNNFQNKNSNLDNQVNLAPKDTLKNKIALIDSTNIKDTTSLSIEKKSPVKIALLFTKTIIRIIFFDYDSFAFNFTNDNSISKSGLYGSGTGFYNFWGITQKDNNGPSRLFMLGLSSEVGRRAPNLNISDNFSQRNNLDFKTQRPLWEGAKIDITWKVSWSINRSTTLLSDAQGNTSISGSPSVSGTLSRSFLSFPPVLFFSVFNSGIKKVAAKYNPQSTDPDALSNAFVQGFESLPIFSRIGFLKNIADYIPRPNWRITWDGLEKFFPFKSFAKRVSLDHAYVSSYTEGWNITPDGIQQKQSQRIEYGFAPFLGLNFTFADLWGGNIISSVKYSTKTNYDLGITTKAIIETFSSEIGITAGYSKSGFELPLFGLFLKNDIEFSFSYTRSNNTSVNYDMSNFVEGGSPQDGTTRTSMEPRVKYTLSSKVTLSVFYTRTSVQPDGPSRIPPSTTNEAGLDVHISIQ